MQTKALLFICFILFVVSANAQETLEENIWKLSEFQIIESEPGFYKNLSEINQLGQNNQLVAIQQLKDATSNSIITIQNGNDNMSYVKQTGYDHRSLLLQDGSGNIANLWSEGGGTQNMVLQKGDDNVVNQFVENYHATSRSVVSVQMGNENEINLALLDREEPNSLMGVMLTQTGDANSAELILNQSDASYMTVTQSGGAEIKVTQTDFYFPMK